MEPLTSLGIITGLLARFIPVFAALVVLFAVSIATKRKTALYGKLFDSPIGMAGFALVMFWVFTALFADIIMTHDPLSQVSGMKNKLPGTALPIADTGAYSWYLLGGDNLAQGYIQPNDSGFANRAYHRALGNDFRVSGGDYAGLARRVLCGADGYGAQFPIKPSPCFPRYFAVLPAGDPRNQSGGLCPANMGGQGLDNLRSQRDGGGAVSVSPFCSLLYWCNPNTMSAPRCVMF